MSSEIRMTGFVSAECKARTVGDLRALVAWCDEYNVSDDCGLDWGSGAVYVELTGDKPKPAEWIECGDHLYPTVKYDFLVNTHYHGPETYEEALEEALEEEKGMPESWWDAMGFPKVRKEKADGA